MKRAAQQETGLLKAEVPVEVRMKLVVEQMIELRVAGDTGD